MHINFSSISSVKHIENIFASKDWIQKRNLQKYEVWRVKFESAKVGKWSKTILHFGGRENFVQGPKNFL